MFVRNANFHVFSFWDVVAGTALFESGGRLVVDAV